MYHADWKKDTEFIDNMGSGKWEVIFGSLD